MKIRLTITTALLAMAANFGYAAHMWEDPGAWWSDHFVSDARPTQKFSAQEVSLDMFGSYMTPERGIEHLFNTDIRSGGHWGGGVGLNYFLTRNLGLGADMNMSNNGGKLVDLVGGNAILRFPIEKAGLAPYIIGGGARGIDPSWQWVGHAGVGLELRWNPTTGIFIDGRYIWADKTSDALWLRAGLRVVF